MKIAFNVLFIVILLSITSIIKAQVQVLPGTLPPCQFPDKYTNCELIPWSEPFYGDFYIGVCKYRVEYYYKDCPFTTPTISIGTIWCETSNANCPRPSDKLVIKSATIKAINDCMKLYNPQEEAFALIGIAPCFELAPIRPDPYEITIGPNIGPIVQSDESKVYTINSIWVYDHVKFCPGECCQAYYNIIYNSDYSEVLDIELDFLRQPENGTQCFYPCASDCSSLLTLQKPGENGYRVDGYGIINFTNNEIKATFNSNSTNSKYSLSIYDYQGNLIITKFNELNNQITINIKDNLISGTFIAVLSNNNKLVCSRKIVIVK